MSNITLPDAYIRQVHFEAEDMAYYMAQKLAPYCESPIEAILGTAMVQLIHIRRSEPIDVVLDGPLPGLDASFYLRPQSRILDYRVDFIAGVSWGVKEAIVECDGREFHHATREQIERDRERDRRLEAADYRVFRFPGTQIYNDPFGCANAVWLWVLENNEGAQ